MIRRSAFSAEGRTVVRLLLMALSAYSGWRFIR